MFGCTTANVKQKGDVVGMINAFYLVGNASLQSPPHEDGSYFFQS